MTGALTHTRSPKNVCSYRILQTFVCNPQSLPMATKVVVGSEGKQEI